MIPKMSENAWTRWRQRFPTNSPFQEWKGVKRIGRKRVKKLDTDNDNYRVDQEYYESPCGAVFVVAPGNHPVVITILSIEFSLGRKQKKQIESRQKQAKRVRANKHFSKPNY